MRNLFSEERNRKMYLAHIRTIMQENFINQHYYARGQSLQNLIDMEVQNDTNKFYSYSDFTTNLTNQVSLVASICPGIKQLMDARSTFLSSYTGFSGEPIISNISTSQNVILGDEFWVTAEVSDATYLRISYRFGDNQIFKNKEMLDNGLNNDGVAGDGIYGCKISNCSNSIDYYFYADNDSSGVFSPVRAAYDFYSIQFKIGEGDLVINEVMANNVSVVSDNSGKFEDWIELYNTTSSPISTNNLFITDTLPNLHKWALPNHIISPNSYFVIWADEDGNQGAEHANFKLSNFGEQLILSNSDSSIIDSITYLPQSEDVSFARNPNGTGPFSMMIPTFNKNNNVTAIEDIPVSSYVCYPNPFSDKLNVICDEGFFVMDIFGRIILESNHSEKTINTSSWNVGFYFIHLKGNSNTTIKLIKIK